MGARYGDMCYNKEFLTAAPKQTKRLTERSENFRRICFQGNQNSFAAARLRAPGPGCIQACPIRMNYWWSVSVYIRRLHSEKVKPRCFKTLVAGKRCGKRVACMTTFCPTSGNAGG